MEEVHRYGIAKEFISAYSTENFKLELTYL